MAAKLKTRKELYELNQGLRLILQIELKKIKEAFRETDRRILIIQKGLNNLQEQINDLEGQI